MARKKQSKAAKTKIKLDEMGQVDGKVQEEESYTPSTLDQVFGDDGTSKYKTLNDDVYKTVLDNMSKADLKNEAIRVGLLPIDNMQQLRIRLLREFRAHASSYKKPRVQLEPTDTSDKARKILEEGM